MVALGIVMMVVGVVVLIGTQFLIRSMIRKYKKSWEDTDEMR